MTTNPTITLTHSEALEIETILYLYANITIETDNNAGLDRVSKAIKGLQQAIYKSVNSEVKEQNNA